MLYPIVRPIASLGLKAFYRKIYLSHTENIPRDKPVILAANHPTAFLEPCILACFLDRPLYFLVRGNLFNKAFYSGLLHSLNMLPVYRLKDGGYGKLKNNYSTFEACYQALAERKTIMILAEGRTIQEKRLRPLQKGTARLALGTLEEHPEVEEVYIVPVGVNFTYADQPRTEVMIDFGKPLLASDFRQEYEENAIQALASLTENLRPRLEACMVVIEREEDEALVDFLHVLHRTESFWPLFPIVAHDYAPLEKEIAVADLVNVLPEAERQALLEKCSAYFNQLRQYRIDDQAVGGKPFSKPFHLLLLALGAPLALAGWLWNFPPAWLGKYISLTRVETLEFVMPVRWATSLGAYLVYILAWVLIAAISGFWALLPAVVVLLFLGHFYLYYREFYERCRKSSRFSGLNATKQEALKKQRRLILKEYTRLENHYRA